MGYSLLPPMPDALITPPIANSGLVANRQPHPEPTRASHRGMWREEGMLRGRLAITNLNKTTKLDSFYMLLKEY